MNDEPLSPLSDPNKSPYRVKEDFISTPKFDPASWRHVQPSPLSSQTSSFIDLDNMDKEVLETSSLTSEINKKAAKTEEKELLQEDSETSSNVSYDVISAGEASAEEKEQDHPNAWGFSALFNWSTRTKPEVEASRSDTESFGEIDIKALESDSSPELDGKI